MPTATAKAKAALAKRRQASAVNLDGLGVLRSGSVKQKTQQRYRIQYDEFFAWVSRKKLKVETEDELDVALAAKLDADYLAGASFASYTLAAVIFYHPAMRGGTPGMLAKSRQAIRGFRHLAPPRSRLPWPWEVVPLLCNHLWLDGDQEMCLALLLMFEMYLRPGEITKLRAVDLVPPVKKSQVHKCFTVVVAPA